MIHFLIGVLFSIVLSAGLAHYTDFRTFWFWFILLQAVSLIQMVWGGIYGWLIWKINEKKVIAKFVREFEAVGFPPYGGGGIFFSMTYLEEVSNSVGQSPAVRELAHQIIVIVRTLNDLKKTAERERYLEAVGEAILQIPGRKVGL